MIEVIGSSVTIAKAFLVNLKNFGYAVCENVAYLLFSDRSKGYDGLNSLAVL